MDPSVIVALVTTGGVLGGAAIAGWSTRSVRRASAKTEANQASLEEKKFAMDFWERRATIAQMDSERWETDYREEHATNVALSTLNEKLSDDRKRMQRELEAIYGDQPELEKKHRQPYEPETDPHVS